MAAGKRDSVRNKRVAEPAPDWLGQLVRAWTAPPKLHSFQVLSVGALWGERFHATPRHELIHVLQGRAEIQSRRRAFAVGPGDTFVIPQGVEHKDLRAEGPDYRVAYLFFEWPSGQTLLESIEPHGLLDAPEGAKAHLHRIVKELEREYQGDAPGSAARIQVLLWEALLALLRNAWRGTNSAAGARQAVAERRGEKLAAEVRAFLDAHYAESIGLDDLAARFDVSPFNLCRRFSKVYGLSVVETLTQIRMEHAREALDAGRLSVKEVALAVGYADANYFAKVFRRMHGVSPTQYLASRR